MKQANAKHHFEFDSSRSPIREMLFFANASFEIFFFFAGMIQKKQASNCRNDGDKSGAHEKFSHG